MNTITVAPLTPTIGAEPSNVDLRESLNESELAEIEQALLD